MEPLAELADRVLSGELRTPEALHRAKVEVCREHGLREVPSNTALLHFIPESQRAQVPLLRRKPVRTASGVAVIALMTSPAPCPHGTCLYCPGGVTWGTPQSYTGTEPAARRALQLQFDPIAQTERRLAQLRALGHPTDKVDLIIIGGTFTARSEGYREAFVRGCFRALNETPSPDLSTAHRQNETARHRCIGLTIETKPDCFLGREVEHSLALGVTRVELGVQSLSEAVLRRVNRGHGVREVIQATRRAREAGLKIGYHMMLGLPGSDPSEDLRTFRELFENPAYRPDMLKIYPTLVVAGTGLHRLWKEGRYRPLETEEAAALLAEIKSVVPPYVRILRINREIPATEIEAGVSKGHIRMMAQDLLAAQGRRCHCIRCREAGLRETAVDPQRIALRRLPYAASRGVEEFLSFEAEDVLIGYARLRLGPQTAFVRELKVFGPLVPFAEDPGGRWQHKGYGRRLVAACEERATSEGYVRLLVTSGVGVRGYYRRLGYRREGPYMAKDLTRRA